MSAIKQVQRDQEGLLLALSTVVDIDGKRMIKRLCRHFSHKVNARWNEGRGYIEFAMGFCDMRGNANQLNFRCGANSEAELREIVDCIEAHFTRFMKQFECSLEWKLTNA